MTYYDRLHPWCIIRLLPNMQRIVIARFRKRNDAEDHRIALQHLTPEANYAIVFDPPDDPQDPPSNHPNSVEIALTQYQSI